MRFLHIADVHLGYQQYGLKERFNDFSKAYFRLVRTAIDHHVDFVLLAGDFFEKRVVDPMAMRVAVEGLEQLLTAHIPVVAVEGNHERAAYGDQFSWVDFLDALGYVCLLNYKPQDGLQPYGENGGAYVDLLGNVRIYGMKYYGASTAKVLGDFAADVAQADHSKLDYAIFMTHAGVEGQIPNVRGTAYASFAPLKEHIDYVALGHYHKPYSLDDWIFNPGAPETSGMDESAWTVRGAYLVEIDLGASPKHRATLLNVPPRPFYRFTLPVDTLADPNAVYDAVRNLIQRKSYTVACEVRSVIELTLTGTLSFSRYSLDIAYIENLLTEAWSPLGQPHVHNKTVPTEFEIRVNEEATRPELERHVLQELLERDTRYRSTSADWAEGALELKRLALNGSPPDAIVAHLRRLRAATSLQEEV